MHATFFFMILPDRRFCGIHNKSTLCIHHVYHAVMKKKLIKHGNSHALIIDKAIQELLGITPDSEVELALDGRKLVIKRHKDAPSESRFERLLSEVHRRYGKALKELAA